MLRATPEVSREAIYQREQRPNNLLRWDVTVEPNMSGEKALAIQYEFKLELDSKMTITDFRSAGVFGTLPPTTGPVPAPGTALTLPPMSPAEKATQAAVPWSAVLGA